MGKKKVQKVPLGQAVRALREQDAAELEGQGESSSGSAGVDVEAVTSGLIVRSQRINHSAVAMHFS